MSPLGAVLDDLTLLSGDAAGDLAHTMHSYIATSSYFDQMAYTLVPSGPPALFSSERYLERPLTIVRPGWKPSISLHVGITDIPLQFVSPNFRLLFQRKPSHAHAEKDRPHKCPQ
jgi:hypothetical protein